MVRCNKKMFRMFFGRIFFYTFKCKEFLRSLTPVEQFGADFAAFLNAEGMKNFFQMIFYGVFRDAESSCNFPVGVPGRRQESDLFLAGGQIEYCEFLPDAYGIRHSFHDDQFQGRPPVVVNIFNMIIFGPDAEVGGIIFRQCAKQVIQRMSFKTILASSFM